MADAQSPKPDRSLPERVFGRVLGSVVPPVVDSVDVDDVVDRIDVNEVVERIDLDEAMARVDVNALLDRVDADRLLDRVDVDRLLDRVDLNRAVDRVDLNQVLAGVDMNSALDRVDLDRQLERVDVNAIVERTELGEIIARSTTGVFTEVLDVVRSGLIGVDQAAQGIPALLLRRTAREVPDSPFEAADSTIDLRAVSSAQRAVGFQGRYAGSVSRFLAFVVDQFLMSTLFAWGTLLVAGAAEVVLGTDVERTDSNSALIVAAYAAWYFIYFAGSLAASGRTVGKALLGLLVVTGSGGRLSGRRAALRTLVFPISFLIFGIGLLLGLFRADRRELHDLVAGTAVVYAWDAETARLRLGGHAPAESVDQ